METNIGVPSAWSRLVARGQPAVLVTACVAGGLTLTMMVIGSTPDVIVQASRAAIEAAPVTPASGAPLVTEVPVDTAPSTDSTEVLHPPVAEAAAPDLGEMSAAAPEPAPVVAPAPSPAPAVPSSAPSVTPTPGVPSAPAPAPVVTSGPLAPVTVAAPQSTAPSPATQPAATTSTPPPTTAAPVTVALTYPSFSAGDAGTVVLQFDGSSIYVSSVARQPNWVSQIDSNGPRTVEVKFFNTVTHDEAEFHATVEGGRIQVEN
jgi:hypothetical protein